MNFEKRFKDSKIQVVVATMRKRRTKKSEATQHDRGQDKSRERQEEEEQSHKPHTTAFCSS
jgi:hypothetical protein